MFFPDASDILSGGAELVSAFTPIYVVGIVMILAGFAASMVVRMLGKWVQGSGGAGHIGGGVATGAGLRRYAEWFRRIRRPLENDALALSEVGVASYADYTRDRGDVIVRQDGLTGGEYSLGWRKREDGSVYHLHDYGLPDDDAAEGGD